ncbi:MAG TPA: HlyD family secretion protein [Bryobacteraceae bacterium]|nr:HlyD family secretion protein [Bryobacteraceae bacterium]
MDRDAVDFDIERELEPGPRTPRSEPVHAAPPPPKQLSRKLIIAGALLLLIAAGLYLWISSWDRVSTDDAQVDGHIIPVSAKIYGNVTEVHVDDNQAVKQGQVLVRLDPRDYLAKVNQASAAVGVAQSQAKGASVGVPMVRETTQSGSSSAEAQLNAAQADFDEAKGDYERAANSDISMARASVDSAQATYDRAQADLNRMRPLMEKEEISRQQYDSYVAVARVAESDLRATRDKVNSATQDAETKRAAMLATQARIAQARAGVTQAQAAQKQVDVRVADVATASANIEQARANLQAAELNLSYTTIVASSDGTVTKKSVEPGQVLQPGQGLLMLVPLNDVWVTANFKETQLRDVRPGQKAEVKVDLTGTTYRGRVDSISSATGTRISLLPPENATGNYVKVVQRIPVKIVLDAIPGGNSILRPGMNVEATILTK